MRVRQVQGLVNAGAAATARERRQVLGKVVQIPLDRRYTSGILPSMGARNGTLIRTTLTADEWERVKAIARERDLNASQLVSQLIRDRLLKGRR